MKNQLNFLFILISFSFSTIGVEISNNMGHLRFTSGELYHLKGHSEANIRSYLYSIRDNLGHENAHSFPLIYYKEGKNNTRHFSFQQAHNDIPVFGRYIRVHVNGNIITSLSSNIENINLSIIPIITESIALDIIRQQFEDKMFGLVHYDVW